MRLHHWHRTSRLALAALITGLAIAGGCNKAAPAEKAEEKAAVAVDEVKATVKPVRDMLDLPGTFVPSQGAFARLTPAVPGRVKEVFVHEGQTVSGGQLLATLDTSVQKAQQSSAQAGLKAAEAQATQSQLAYEAAKVDHENTMTSSEIALQQARAERQNDVTQARLANDVAQADLAKIQAGPRPQEVAQAHEGVVQARAARDRAAIEYRRNDELWPTGYISRRQLDDSKTALDTEESALKVAVQNESLVRAGARPEERRAAIAHAAAAKEAVASAQSLGDKKVAAAETALRQAQSALSLAAKRMDAQTSKALAVQKAADTATASATTTLSEIRAPYDGRVTRRQLNQGDFADTTTPILEIAQSGGATDFLATTVPAQAAKIKAGMQAEIEADPEPVEGRVVSVSTADPQTGLISVRIASGAHSVTGTFSTAHVIVGRLPSAVVVPDDAVLNKDGKSIVVKDVDGVAKQTEVKTGPSDGGFTAILTGLKEGDAVVHLGGYELDDGAKITPAAKDKGDDAGKKDDSAPDKGGADKPAADEKAAPDKPKDEKAAAPDKKEPGP